MHRSTLLAAGVLTGALVLGAGSAWAETDTVKDKSGDAAPAADITRVTVRNAGKALMVQAKLAKASAGRTHLVATLTPAAEGAATYVARTVEPAAGHGHGHRAGATLETAGDGAPVDCRGIHAAVSAGRHGQVTIRIPQACFGTDAGTFTVAVTTVTAAGEVADETPTDPTVDQG